MSIGELQKAVPDISVVIVTFNSEKFVVACLESVCSPARECTEVIVVDNGSSDRTIAFIRKKFPNVTLIENAENKGASEARNQGIERALGRWILTLDSDVVSGGSFLDELMSSLNAFPPEIGMAQPKILRSDGKTIYSCGIHLSWSRRFYDIGFGTKDKKQFSRTREIFGPCAAAALYRRSMLETLREDTGYFDTRFFFLVEDVDLAWRARKNGWKGIFLPEAVCYHSGNSSRTLKKKRQFLCLRNRYLTIRKNEGFLRYYSKILPFVVYDIPRLCFLFFTNPFLRRFLLRRWATKDSFFTHISC